MLWGARSAATVSCNDAHAHHARGGSSTGLKALKRPVTILSALPPWHSMYSSESVRERKDPAAWGGDMDRLRKSLETPKGQFPGLLSGLLNTLSATSFGREASQAGWSIGKVYRTFLALGTRPREQQLSAPTYTPRLGTLDQVLVTRLTCTLSCQPQSLETLLQKYPEAAQLPAAELAARLLGLKSVLPGADVAGLVMDAPRLFLEGEQHVVEAQVGQAARLLREGLPGADVDAMVQLDPGLLFIDVARAVHHMKDLWAVDAAALAASDPAMLALALRTLCKCSD